MIFKDIDIQDRVAPQDKVGFVVRIIFFVKQNTLFLNMNFQKFTMTLSIQIEDYKFFS